MTAYRPPDFKERAALARDSRQKALDRLRAKPKPSEAELAALKAARIAREEEEAARRIAEKQAAAEARALAAEAERAAQAAIVPPPPPPPELTEAEKKAARDARYAARKNRK